MNPDSAVEIEPNVRARCKPGAVKIRKRIVSRSCLVLGPPLRSVSEDCSIHRSRVAAKGQRSIVFAVEGLCRALYATANCGIRDQDNP